MTTIELSERSSSTADMSKLTNSSTVGDDGDHTLGRRPWRLKSTPWNLIVNHPYKGSGTDEEPYVVTWLDEGVECENPREFGVKYKWTMTLIAAVGMLATTMTSSILSAALATLRVDFPGHEAITYTWITSIYIAGFVCGPFLWAPLCEVLGRRFTAIVTLFPFAFLNAGVCGVKTMPAMLAIRFFAGVLGCSPMTNAPALISDIWDNAQRGVAMGVFGAMPWLGPVIGPIVGGFLSEAAGWRWVAAVAALFAFVLAMAHLLFLPETFNALILRERAALLHKVTGKIYRCEADVAQPPDIAKLLKRQFKVPFILLFTEPIVAILSLYMAAVFGILYLQFTAFPLVFTKERHWGPGVSSLPFIGISVGCNLALLWLIFLGNPAYAKQLRAAKGYLDPESRLGFSSVVGAIMMPVGLTVFAWTAVPVSIPWIVCVLSTVPYGAGMVVVFIAVNNYLVDAYLPTAASVMAGATVVRSLVGAFLPLATVKMYAALGINWGAMVVAFIAMIFVPVPFLLQRYGKRIRLWTKYGRQADVVGKRLGEMARERHEAHAKSLADAAAGTAAGTTETINGESTGAAKGNPNADEKLDGDEDGQDQVPVLQSDTSRV